MSTAPDEQVRKAAEQEGRHYLGCILASPAGEGDYRLHLAVRPDLGTDNFEWVCKETVKRHDRLLEEGPELDGWRKRSDGDLQMWLTAHQLDPWLTGD